MKTRADLYKECGRVLDMCEGILNLGECIKYNGQLLKTNNPTFPSSVEKYSFAIGIVEDKPVFVGDRLWSTSVNNYVIVGYLTPDKNNEYFDTIYMTYFPYVKFSTCSWNKPNNKFEDASKVYDSVISFHNNKRTDDKEKLISCNIGRQYGTSTYIANNFKDSDIIITKNKLTQNHIESLLFNQVPSKFSATNSKVISISILKDSHRYIGSRYNTVWVDNYSLFTLSEIADIFYIFSDKCDIIIGLG